VSTGLHKLKPYKSFLLAKVKDGVDLDGIVQQLLDDVITILKVKEDGPRKLITKSPPESDAGLHVAYIHFTEEQPVAWIEDDSVSNLVHQLVLVCRRDRYVGLCVSDNRLRTPIVRRIGRPRMAGLSSLEPINPGFMNAAFVRGITRTLWLSGTHRRSTVKADSKILSGLNLRDALNPLEDQSYYFTAARSNADIEGLRSPVVGASPRGSRIWVGVSTDWADFRDTAAGVLRQLKKTKKPIQAPLPVVAVSAVDAKKVADAFDVGLVPPEGVTDDPNIDPETLAALERWSYGGDFRITKTDGASFEVDMVLAGISVGIATFEVTVESAENVHWAISGKARTAAQQEEHRKALDLCNNRAWLKVWYDSGQTLSDGALFEIRHRDMPFWGFQWGNLDGFDITREKPDPLDEIGRQDSLFCWVQQFWPNLSHPLKIPGGWLACDDGSMEIADFIHLDERAHPPILSLIHVKGAGSDREHRGISVSKYEVVTGQAVKNLRSLDRLLLDAGLRSGIGTKVGDLVWHNRRRTGRRQMLDALARLGAEYQRRIVIVQPHVKKTIYEEARAHPRSLDAARLQQLDTLLLSAEASAHGAGASLTVIGGK